MPKEPQPLPAIEPASMAALIGAFATLYLVWGSTYLAIRVAVQTMPPFMMTSCRFFVAGTIMALYVFGWRRERITMRQWWDNVLIGGILLLGGTGLVSWAETSVPSGITTLIVSTNPVFTVIADWAYHRFVRKDRVIKPSGFTLLGLAMGFVGLGLLVGPSLWEQGALHLEAIPVLALLFACSFWTLGSIYSKYTKYRVEPIAGASIQMISGGGWLLVISLLAGEHRALDILSISAASIWAWVYLVVAGSLVAYTTYLWLMKHSSPTMVSTYAYVNPIVAVFLGWWLLSEPLTPRIFIAAAVIIASVATITITNNRGKDRIPDET